MPLEVINTAICNCSMGMAPSALAITPKNRVLVANQPAANIGDHIPFMNVLPFANCRSMGNPSTAAATVAALGVLAPMPCTPMTFSPWITGAPTVLIAGLPALDNISILPCSYGGIITIAFAGQTTVMVP